MDLAGAVLYVCPACGVVNPSGPSESCPHVQLIRFDGVDGELSDLLAEVAAARRGYNELVDRLKRTVKQAVRSGEAVVETPGRRGRLAEEDEARRPSEELYLTNPEPPPPRKRPARKKRRDPPPVDPRQLELLAMGPSKGDA
ncbi:MAG: hypothetical protein R6V85_13350 [Polyangia bacterium]